MYGQNNQNFEKNPNGGYANKSQYGEDAWYANIDITPPLLEEIRKTGKLTLSIKDVQTTQYGPCRRVIAKAYSPAVRPDNAGQGYSQPQTHQQPHNAGPGYQGGYAPQQQPPQVPGGYVPPSQPQQGYPAPAAGGYNQQPQNNNFQEDSIPF